ncbi:MAG TPA: YtxH domain-containing protein [Longimicrobiales bacterium]|nr:YtxH domain-containing protein [Longimicrobiales bacterium]
MARHRNDEDLPYIIVERSGDDGGGLLPFLWGALVGAGVALLFAPRSGAETRAELSSGARRLRDAAEETVRGVQESVTGAVDGVREQVTGRVSVARNAYDAGRSAARESRAQMEARIREARLGFEAGADAARDGHEFTDDDLDEDEL